MRKKDKLIKKGDYDSMKTFEEPQVIFVEIDSDIITTSSLCVSSGGNDLPPQSYQP